MTRLVLMCGMPGSGKTTLARRLADALPAVRMCPDEWMAGLQVDLYDEDFRHRLEAVMWVQAQDLLTSGIDVVLESGHWLRDDRDTKRTWARAHDVRVELWWLDVPLEERWRRIRARNAALEPGHVLLTLEDLRRYVGFFQAPDDAELALFDPPATTLS